MKNLKIIKVDQDFIEFDNGIKLYSDHNSECCEAHFLSFNDLTIDDFDGLEFNIKDDRFFRKIDGYGIELIPIKGYSIKIPGYGYNNGYYSSNLTLTLNGLSFNKEFDISECQSINNC